MTTDEKPLSPGQSIFGWAMAALAIVLIAIPVGVALMNWSLLFWATVACRAGIGEPFFNCALVLHP